MHINHRMHLVCSWTLIGLFLALLALNTQCGRGGGDGSLSGSTPVKIVFGEVRTGPGTTASLEKGKLVSNNLEADRIAGITVTGRQLTTCRITITGQGMTDIVREVEIAGRDMISETFVVKSGINRYILIEFFDNENNALFSADRAGVNLEGELVEIEVQVEPTDTYLAPPSFPGIDSIENVPTRSVRLNWQPATDNLTPQDRIQYMIYLSNESIEGDPDVNSVFETVYTLGNATILEGDPLMLFTYESDELILISYDYEGEVLDGDSPSGRLTPGIPYYFIVKAKDEFGRLDENFVESEVTVYMLDVETIGSGTVNSDPPGIDCGTSCSEDYLSGTVVTLTATPDTNADFEGWSGDESCSGTGNCIITMGEDTLPVTATFCQAYYEDFDGDGYGDQFSSSCIQLEGYVTNNTDCDDNNQAINPDAIEICDGLDNNCDGLTDEGFDNDGDGYTSCGGDCDDTNPGVNPGEAEVCDTNRCDSCKFGPHSTISQVWTRFRAPRR